MNYVKPNNDEGKEQEEAAANLILTDTQQVEAKLKIEKETTEGQVTTAYDERSGLLAGDNNDVQFTADSCHFKLEPKLYNSVGESTPELNDNSKFNESQDFRDNTTSEKNKKESSELVTKVVCKSQQETILEDVEDIKAKEIFGKTVSDLTRETVIELISKTVLKQIEEVGAVIIENVSCQFTKEIITNKYQEVVCIEETNAELINQIVLCLVKETTLEIINDTFNYNNNIEDASMELINNISLEMAKEVILECHQELLLQDSQEINTKLEDQIVSSYIKEISQEFISKTVSEQIDEAITVITNRVIQQYVNKIVVKSSKEILLKEVEEQNSEMLVETTSKFIKEIVLECAKNTICEQTESYAFNLIEEVLACELKSETNSYLSNENFSNSLVSGPVNSFKCNQVLIIEIKVPLTKDGLIDLVLNEIIKNKAEDVYIKFVTNFDVRVYISANKPEESKRKNYEVEHLEAIGFEDESNDSSVSQLAAELLTIVKNIDVKRITFNGFANEVLWKIIRKGEKKIRGADFLKVQNSEDLEIATLKEIKSSSIKELSFNNCGDIKKQIDDSQKEFLKVFKKLKLVNDEFGQLDLD